MKYLSETTIKKKKILLRCDFNVPIKDGVITDDTKIKLSLKTINYLLKNDNTVIILSHFGRVKKEEDKNNNSLKVVYEYLKNIMDIEFIEDPLHLEAINDNSNKCYLVENTRFTDVPVKRESSNDLKLAKYWAQFASVFVIDAFASLHRLHASTAGLANYLDTYLGFLVEEEIKGLEPLIKNNTHPFLVIMGGAKVDDKIKIIESLIEKCDKIIITGGILNTFLKVKGYNVGNSLVSNEEDVLEVVHKLLTDYNDKIFYSKDFVVERLGKKEVVSLDEIEKDDIIYDNLVNFDNLISDAEIIFFNGTCGKYENELYQQGTLKLLENLRSKKDKVYIGGGDTVSAVHNLGFSNEFAYLSSGGGATLSYVAEGKLDVLEYIENQAKDN